MRRALLVCTLLVSSLSAQTSRKPLFPLPNSISEAPAVSQLAPELKQAIAPELAANTSCKSSGAEQYRVAELDLKHEGAATLIRVDEPCLCDAANNCPIFVVQKSKLLLHDGQGFGYALIPNPKGGDTPELVIASHTSATVTALQRYRWKGGKFKLQDCEAVYRKELARSTGWVPEDFEITGCDAIVVK